MSSEVKIGSLLDALQFAFNEFQNFQDENKRGELMITKFFQKSQMSNSDNLRERTISIFQKARNSEINPFCSFKRYELIIAYSAIYITLRMIGLPLLMFDFSLNINFFHETDVKQLKGHIKMNHNNLEDWLPILLSECSEKEIDNYYRMPLAGLIKRFQPGFENDNCLLEGGFSFSLDYDLVRKNFENLKKKYPQIFTRQHDWAKIFGIGIFESIILQNGGYNLRKFNLMSYVICKRLHLPLKEFGEILKIIYKFH